MTNSPHLYFESEPPSRRWYDANMPKSSSTKDPNDYGSCSYDVDLISRRYGPQCPEDPYVGRFMINELKYFGEHQKLGWGQLVFLAIHDQIIRASPFGYIYEGTNVIRSNRPWHQANEFEINFRPAKEEELRPFFLNEKWAREKFSPMDFRAWRSAPDWFKNTFKI